LFRAELKKYPSDEFLVSWVKNYFENNIYADINFGSPSFIELISRSSDYPKTIELLIKLKGKVRDITPHIALNKKFYKTSYLLIRKSSVENLSKIYNGKTILDILLLDDYISTKDREKFLQELLIKGVDSNLTNYDNDNITKIINCNSSYRLLEILFLRSNKKIKKIDTDTIDLILKLGKIKELILIYKKRCKLPSKNNILFRYFEMTDQDSNKNLDILETILKNTKNINKYDDNQLTPLFYAIKNDRIRSFKKMIEYGADPFIKNNKKMNCLIYSLKWNRFAFVDYLKNYNNEGKYLLKEKFNSKTPFMLALFTNNPIKYLSSLIEARKSKIYLRSHDKNGFNIYSYLLKRKFTRKQKKILLLKLLPIIDVTQTNKIFNQPILIQATELNEYNFVYEICIYLLRHRIIQIDGLDDLSGLEKLLRSNKKIHVKSDNQNEINYYPSVFMYLRQNTNNRMISMDDSESELVLDSEYELSMVDGYILYIMIHCCKILSRNSVFKKIDMVSI
jgi:ankyrin repeat protein